MEVINKLISQTKCLAMEEEDLKEELIQMKTKLLAEETNLALVKMEQEKLAQHNALLEQSLEFANNNFQLMTTFQNVAKSSIMLHSFLEVFMENADPTDKQQSENLAKLKGNYTKMLQKYESAPIYKAILQEEVTERELSKSIADKKAELEKLYATEQ